MNVSKSIAKICLIASIAAAASGCASAPEVKKRFFWPSPPDEPKVEWLGAYRTESDLPKTSSQKFRAKVIGEDEPLKFNRPMGITSDGDGRVYITDPNEQRVLVYDFNVNKVHVLGEKYKELASLLKEPIGIAVDNAGRIYVSDAAHRKIFIYDKDEQLINRINMTEDTKRPIGLAVDSQRKRIIVGDSVVHNLEVYDFNGKHIKTIGKIGSQPGEFFGVNWVAVANNGNIVVSEFRNCRIQVLDPEGNPIRVFGKRGDRPGELQMPKGIAVDSEGHIYSVDGKSNSVNIFSETGEYLITIGGSYAAEKNIAPGGFLLPQGIGIDKNDTIYVVDQFNFRFQKFQYINEAYKKANPIEPATPSGKSL